MPKSLQYRAGSLIYFQGDPADRVFVLQSGRVNLKSQDIETSDEVQDQVMPGEFFGVKSALGRYPREENAVVTHDAAVLVFTVGEFEALAASNTRIIMKMLKVFSNQLRKIHNNVSSLMANEEKDPEGGLYAAAEHYLKVQNYPHARYVFDRYLTYYPGGKFSEPAAAKLQEAEAALSSKEWRSGQVKTARDGGAAAPLEGTAKSYYDAVSLMSQQKYQQAQRAFKTIADKDDGSEYVPRAFFEIGTCLFRTSKFDDCIKHYTQMISKYPDHEDLADALFYVGQSYEKMNRKPQAEAVYKKIINMAAADDDGAHAKAKQALRELGK